jgi:hypothetical protein
MSAAFDRPFYAAIGRYVLCFQSDPVPLLRLIAKRVRSGGIILFHEPDWEQMRSVPPAPTYGRECQWVGETCRRSGVDVRDGIKLYSKFPAAGLHAVIRGANAVDEVQLDAAEAVVLAGLEVPQMFYALRCLVLLLAISVSALVAWLAFKIFGHPGFVLMGILILFVAQRINIERDIAIGPMYSGEMLEAQAANLDRMTRSERAGHQAERLRSRQALQVANIVGFALLIFGGVGWYSGI